MSSVLLAGPPTREHSQPSGGPPVPPLPPSSQPEGAGRSNALSIIAGVGVLLLAMGVGVLIGRSGNSKSTPAPPQVISVASAPAAIAPSSAAEAPFSDDWPVGTSGYTVELQKLPQAGTAVSAVAAAKTSASANGATAVGALRSEDFSGLPAGSYVIYSGVYPKRAEAQKALTGLRKAFPSATVIRVSAAPASSSSGSSSGASGHAASSAVGSSESHPAPPTVLKSLNSTKGKTYEEKSKNLPDVVETG